MFRGIRRQRGIRVSHLGKQVTLLWEAGEEQVWGKHAKILGCVDMKCLESTDVEMQLKF